MTPTREKKFVPTYEQRRAIEHVLGPMLVVAGVGTGKTTVLTQRIAHLIASRKAQPNQILALTYTRNAAGELLQRVAGLLYPGDPHGQEKLEASGLLANTFHGYCYELLRQAGISFALVDDIDLFVLLRRRLEDLDLKYFTVSRDPGKFLKDLRDFFQRCHDELRTPDDYDAYVAQLERGDAKMPRVAKSKEAGLMSDTEVIERCREIARVFRFTEELLAREGLGTFGHLITRVVALLSSDASLLERARQQAKFLLIDEFQDSNMAQIRLAKLLGGDDANVVAVGDPDQAVYRFRGASSQSFDQFLKTFGPEAVARVTMVSNRRSTPPILRTAYEAISQNPQISSGVLGRKPWERHPLQCGRLKEEPQLTKASPVELVVYYEGRQEAEFIADTIAETRQRDPKTKLSDFAVLYRNHGHRDEVVEELRRRHVPFKVKGVDLFDTREIRNAMAVLRLMTEQDPVSLFRFAALPQFEIDPVRFRAALAASKGTSMEKVLETVPGGLTAVEAIRELRHDLQNASGSSLAAAMKLLSGRFGVGESVAGRRLLEFAEAWQKKPKALNESQTLAEFLAYVDLFREAGGVLPEIAGEQDPVGAIWPELTDGDTVSDAVQLMTIHAAKGLEFPSVFVVRVSSSSFPSSYKETLVEFPAELRDKDTEGESDSKELHYQEERRLFYVGMTRAKNKLYLYGKRGSGAKNPVPSRYLQELSNATAKALKDDIVVKVLPLPDATLESNRAVETETEDNLKRWIDLPPRPGGRLEELSASAIGQYETCPLAFKLARDWNLPSEPMASMQFGAAMHVALKSYFSGVAAGRPPNEEAVIQCFLDEFTKAKIEEDLQRRMFEKDGRQQLSAFLRSSLAQPIGIIIEASEKKFRIDVDGTVVTGSMDRVDRLLGDEVAILDYKTGKPFEQKDADESLQMSVYALAARRMGMNPKKLVLINLADTTPVTTERSLEDDAETEAKITDVARRIANAEFDATPDFLICKRCAYYSICPEQEVEVEPS